MLGTVGAALGRVFARWQRCDERVLPDHSHNASVTAIGADRPLEDDRFSLHRSAAVQAVRDWR